MNKRLKNVLVVACAMTVCFCSTIITIHISKAEKNAMGYELCFVETATLDFTNENTITHEKDVSKLTTVGKLSYFDYNGDLLSVVDDENAVSGKAVHVATSQDYPRTRFEVESNYLYKFSYNVKMTDETKWDSSFGISPYINLYAQNSDGEVSLDDGGHDFHRDYVDVVYEYSETYKATEFYIGTSFKNNRMTVNLYDSIANAFAKNERDSFKYKEGYDDFCYFDIAFYMQGGAKTMSYQISNISLSVYSVVFGENEFQPLNMNYDIDETFNETVFSLDLSDQNSIIIDAIDTNSSSNPGKIVVNGKDEFISIVDDTDVASGKAVQVKNATDYPRIRLNTLLAEKTYRVSYKIKMTDESKWPAEGGSLGITPYIEFTTYNPTVQDWNTCSGYDFHCGYKDVQYLYNNTYKTTEFYFSTSINEGNLTLNIYGDATAYHFGIPTETYKFAEGYTELVAMDMAFYKQGSASEMAYRIADFTVTTIADPIGPSEPGTNEPKDPIGPSEPETNEPVKNSGGCGSSVGIGSLAFILFGAVAFFGLKHKNNNKGIK